MPEAPTLPELYERRSKLTTDLYADGSKLGELRTKPADQRGDTHNDDLRSAAVGIQAGDAELRTVDALIAHLEAEAKRNEKPEARGPEAAFAELRGENRSAGDAVAQNEEYRAWADRKGEYRDFPAVEVRTLLTSGTTDPAAGLWRPVGQPLPPNVREQRLFVRDVLSVVQTTLASVPYIQELNPATNESGATTVSEGSAKPEVTMQFQQLDAPMRKIAAWIPVTTEIMQDAPTLRGYINTRLAYMLAFREEAQILNGNGTAPNIKGIRQFTVQTQSIVAGDFPATLGLAIGKIENVDGFPTAVAVNPLDYWVAVTTRHSSTFDNGFGGNAPAAISGVTWGLPAIRTRSMESGKALVGDYRMGATMFEREGVTIRTSDSHDTYFIYNKEAILAEERAGLAVHRPDLFVEATVPTS